MEHTTRTVVAMIASVLGPACAICGRHEEDLHYKTAHRYYGRVVAYTCDQDAIGRENCTPLFKQMREQRTFKDLCDAVIKALDPVCNLIFESPAPAKGVTFDDDCGSVAAIAEYALDKGLWSADLAARVVIHTLRGA